MRIKDNYVLQEVADEYIVVPVGEESQKLGGIIRLNETGAFLWLLLKGTDYSVHDLTCALSSKFSIEPEIAEKDIYKFIQEIHALGCLQL